MPVRILFASLAVLSFAGALAAYPVIIGFYLSRRKITDEVADWV